MIQFLAISISGSHRLWGNRQSYRVVMEVRNDTVLVERYTVTAQFQIHLLFDPVIPF